MASAWHAHLRLEFSRQAAGGQGGCCGEYRLSNFGRLYVEQSRTGFCYHRIAIHRFPCGLNSISLIPLSSSAG